MKRHGFVGGVQERLAGRFGTTAEIYAAVEQFRSPATARAELARRYLQARQRWRMPGARFSPFPVRDVPASAGYDWATADAGHTVLFSGGQFVYAVSTNVPPDAQGAPSRAQVIAAARAWSRRMLAGGPV